MDVAALMPGNTDTNASRTSQAFAGMGSDSFLQLLITQLANQDPMQPMGNEELLRQISLIRDIESSTSISSAMRALTGQQKFGSATTMIGRVVRSVPQADGRVIEGVVTSIRLDPKGGAILGLAGGAELPMDQVAQIESAQQAAERLVGKEVIGMDLRRPAGQQTVRGIVTGVGVDDAGEPLLQLDNADLRFRDVISVVES